VLTDVLFLPWGFEIYPLLTLTIECQAPDHPTTGRTSSSSPLTRWLHARALPLERRLRRRRDRRTQDRAIEEKWLREPIRDARLWTSSTIDPPDRRRVGIRHHRAGDKNFLKVIRIALERKNNIRVYGGVRFGGTLTIEDAFDELGFDHIAIAAGAGTPTIVRMKNNLIRGIRKASDFLMALQLTGAFKKASMANLQVRLPALVIGGGLTAIDTSTELFAYYPLQVEKILERYELSCSDFGEDIVRGAYDAEERGILDEFLGHGRAIHDERARAALAGEKPDFIPLVRAWGGVSIAYRKSMLDSPAYRLNHEEVVKSLEEGIYYAENLADRGACR
jgi:hypothetical protein